MVIGFFNSVFKNIHNIPLNTCKYISSKVYSCCCATDLQTFSSSQTETVPIEHHFLTSLPRPGTQHPAFCFYEFDDSRDLVGVGSYSICLFVSVSCQ